MQNRIYPYSNVPAFLTFYPDFFKASSYAVNQYIFKFISHPSSLLPNSQTKYSQFCITIRVLIHYLLGETQWK